MRARVNVDDLMSESDVMRKLDKALPLIAKELEKSDGRVYVHCAMGMSRSRQWSLRIACNIYTRI